MPNLRSNPLPYNVRGRAKNVKSTYFDTLVIDEPGSNDKAFVVTKSELADDYNRIGEIPIIIRPEDPMQTKTSFFTADTLIRCYLPVSKNLHQRGLILQDDIDFLNQVSRQSLANWKNFQALRLMFVSLNLKTKSIRWLNARTQRRKVVGGKADRYAEFKDSLGRPNPLIVSTVLSASSRLFQSQQAFDVKSIQSVENWGRLGQSLADSIESDMEQLFHLLNRGTSLVSSQLPKFLRKLWLKPMIYAALFTRFEITQNGLNEQSKNQIRSAFIAEMALIDLSSALSVIRDHPNQFDANTAKLLEFISWDLDIHSCYNQLFDKIGQLVLALSHDYLNGDLTSGKKSIAKIKSWIRNRYVDNEDSPWNYDNALATP